MREFTKIKIEKADKTGKIILNSPETLNIIEKETFQEINEALDYFENSEEKIVLLSAVCGVSRKKKKIFSAGINLKKYDEKLELAQKYPERLREELKTARALMTRIEKFKKPVVIGINGLVTGGFFELALSCDVILVSKSAVLSLNEVNIGLIPGYGGIHRLSRVVGKNRAFEIIATARHIKAKEALDLGIAAMVFSDRNFESYINEYCNELALKPSNSLFLVKNTMQRIAYGGDIEETELETFTKALCSEDAINGINAFFWKNHS